MLSFAWDSMADLVGAKDVLVFEVKDDRLALRGGYGRGAGWAGVVDTPLAEEPHVARALTTRRPQRISAKAPVRVIGPYWSAEASVIPVGDAHIVVFGGDRRLSVSEGELVRHAADAVATAGGVSPAKLLADELELVHAIRAVMDHEPTSVLTTATHVAATAADALSCEIAAVLVRHGDRSIVGAAGPLWHDRSADPEMSRALEALAERVVDGPLLEQQLDDASMDALIRETGLVSRYVLRMAQEEWSGVLMVGHAATQPRGFTSLCQRVGRSIADAGETLLSRAIAREQLAAERDRFAQLARTDALTGLGNRTAWIEALTTEASRAARYGGPLVVGSVDLDGLKAVNDRYGHQRGDELLVGAAEVLRSTTRATDFVSRIGGDEFALLLPETTLEDAHRLADRISEAAQLWRGSVEDLRLSLSIGVALVDPSTNPSDAYRVADELMLAMKANARRGG